MIEFLVDQQTCSDPGLGQILYVVKNVMALIQIIVPIILIVVSGINLTKLVINPEEKKGLKKVINSLIAAVVVFMIPVIVNAVMYMLNDAITLSDCWNKASNKTGNTEYIPIDDERQSHPIYEDPSDYKKGETTTTTTEKGSTTQTGKYYPPLEGTSFSIGSASTTGGCSNTGKVYHDVAASVGTKVYAGMDGIVEYSQWVCGGVLFSYGNLAKLTDATTGTYILYAHLSKFVDVDAPVTATCASSYPGVEKPCRNGCSGTQKVVRGTKTVKKGDLIGYTGNVGNSAGPHLHVEIHENGSKECVEDPYAAFGMR